MNTNGRIPTDEPNVVTSFSGLAHDVIEMAELQAQLLSLDVNSTGRNARGAFVLTVVGASFLLSSISVGLFAVAQFLVENLGWSQSAGDFVAALIGIAAGGAVLAGAWYRWQSGLSSLTRSRDELSRNIAWVKSSLRRQAVPPHVAERGGGAPPNPR